MNKPSAQSQYLENQSPCFYCKYLTSIGDNTDYSGWTCKAFPQGIPEVILKRRMNHKEVIDIYPGQVLPYLFEGREEGGKHYNYKGVLV